MKTTITRTALALAAATIATIAALALVVPVGAHDEPTPRCSGETYAVVARTGDQAMAELVASWEVLDTECLWVSEQYTPTNHGDLLDVIEDYDIRQVLVLGGTAAVSADIYGNILALANQPQAHRIAGTTRLDTAKRVLKWIDDGKGFPSAGTQQIEHSHTRCRRTKVNGGCDQRYIPPTVTFSHTHPVSPECDLKRHSWWKDSC